MLKLLRRKWFWISGLFVFFILVLYLFHLNHVIVSRFEARRWNLPSRVFSDAYDIYDGKTSSVAEIQDRLAHLGYRPTPTTPHYAGEFTLSGNGFEIFLHDFQYPHENFKGHTVRFEINNNSIQNLQNVEGKNPSKVVRLEPELIASIFDDKMEDRTFVSLQEIPRVLTQAVLLIEDERFYSHHGIDPLGILRAIFANIASGRVVQGGSTLTQQMVKNFFLTQEKTLTRKFNEALMSLIIDLRYSKDEILEVYLNEIYFGQRGSASVTGVQEASRLYFSKNVSQLTADEAASLAALIKAPGLYSPFANVQKHQDRRDLILKRLLENNSINKTDYHQAIGRALPQKQALQDLTTAPYFIDFVKQQLRDNFPVTTLNSEGLRIFTTLDMHLQRLAENAVQKQIVSLEQQRELLKKNMAAGKHLEGALISIDPKTGFILSYVGGSNYAQNQFDILSLAKRQPGSTFKPFAYLTALSQTNPSFTAATLINDIPLGINTGSGTWKPVNYDNKFHGPVTLREALEKSYNVATVSLGQEVGFENVVNTAKRAGITSELKPYPSLVLGSFEVTPLEMIQAYTIFPNNGTRTKPFAIRRVVTPDGDVLEKKSFEMEDVFSPDVIYIMNKLLQGVLDRGTAASARAQGFDKLAAGKTGTTSDYRDSWFVGYTPALLTLTWVGYKGNETTGLSGASGALPIWTNFMKRATANRFYTDFEPTSKIIILPIDRKSRLLHQSSCGNDKYDEYFIEGTEPSEFCK